MSSYKTIKTTYEFQCPCGYNIINTSNNAKKLAEKLHSKKCDTYKNEKDMNYIKTKTFNNAGKQKSKRTEYLDKEIYYNSYKNTR